MPIGETSSVYYWQSSVEDVSKTMPFLRTTYVVSEIFYNSLSQGVDCEQVLQSRAGSPRSLHSELFQPWSGPPAGACSQASQGKTTIVLANFYFRKIKMSLQPHYKGRQQLYFLHTRTCKIDPWNNNDTKINMSQQRLFLWIIFQSERVSVKLINIMLTYLFLLFPCKFNVIVLLLCQCLKKNWQKT